MIRVDCEVAEAEGGVVHVGVRHVGELFGGDVICEHLAICEGESCGGCD